LSFEISEQLRRLEIPGRMTVLEGNGSLPKLEVTTDHSTAEIYLHGAHVTDFQRKGEAPLLFTSQFSRFMAGQPIRGGVPIIFPWFGSREGEPTHGFARLCGWHLHEAVTLPEGGVTLRFHLPETGESGVWPSFNANYIVTINDTLSLELLITNTSADENFSFDTCLHSYLSVGDIREVEIFGLKGASYFDRIDHFTRRILTTHLQNWTEEDEPIRIASEVDRVYLDTPRTVEVRDHKLGRIIRVEKTGSASTVLWNPWIDKAQQMPDFGNEEYKQMVCVESGNVAKNRISLPPGRTTALKVSLSSSRI
jgi:D-hexose-6-phosphate mutarotase